VTLETRTARLTILIDPRKKAVFERLCAEDDVTASQMVRKFIRAYIEGKTGRPWRPEDEPPPSRDATSSRRARRRDRSGGVRTLKNKAALTTRGGPR
jgi:Ribbon-helix-helix protein